MLLAMDVGGTSSRAVLVDRTGRCGGYGASGGGNPVSWGPDLAGDAIAEAVTLALAQAGPVPVAGTAIFAMAGGSSFLTADAVRAQLRRRGVHCAVRIVPDLLATFCAGTPRLAGYALVAGTGSAAIRVGRGRVVASADGLGWLLGDAGSGFWIGHRAVRAAMAGMEGRGPATALTGLLLDRMGVARGGRSVDGRPAALRVAVEELYRRRPVELAGFAALAFEAAGVGEAADATVAADPVASEILRAATERLLQTLRTVRIGGVGGPVVLGGGVARRLPGLAAAIAADMPGPGGAGEVITVPDGVLGAAVLALRHDGLRVDRAMFDRLAGGLAALR